MLFLMKKSEPPKVYTTRDAAKICMCSQQNIIRCIDNEVIKGYRLPGSTHRRILASELYKYMIKKNIPITNFPKEDIPKDDLESLAEVSGFDHSRYSRSTKDRAQHRHGRLLGQARTRASRLLVHIEIHVTREW